MGDPELRSDEKVLVRTPGVYVKSIPFEGILTNKRIILIDRAKNLLPPKEIPLITIKEVETGENAIRDQIITLSIMARTGETRQMILTFSRQAGGNRIKERDAWISTIREYASSSYDQVIRKVIPSPEPAIRKPEATGTPRYEVVHSPVRQPGMPADEISPVRRVIATGPAPAPAPVFPPVQYGAPAPESTVFCSKCGNRVPAESVFCNRCGAPIARSSPVSPPVQTPTVSAPAQPQPVPSPVQTFTIATPPAQPAPVPPVPWTPTARPIDEEIQSIEPLIARDTTRVPADVLRQPVAEPPKQPLTWDEDEEPEEVSSPAAPDPGGKPAGGGFIPRLFSAKPAGETVPEPVPSYSDYGGSTDLPPKPPRSRGILPEKRTILVAAGGLVAILLVAAAALVLLPMLGSGGTPGDGNTSDTITPVPTTGVVEPGKINPITFTTQPVPPTGVYVHVNYLGGFTGSYGETDAVVSTGDSLDKVWEVLNPYGDTANGTVQARFEKTDGSSHQLLVEIIRDGKVLTSGSTTVGHGSVALSVDLVTGKAAAPVTSGEASDAGTRAAAPVATSAPVKTTAATTVPSAVQTSVPATTVAATTTTGT